MPRLIALNGRLHSGKDTAFAFIKAAAIKDARRNERPEPVVQRIAFADPLKVSAARALGFTAATAEEGVAICNVLKESGKVHVTWDAPDAPGTPRGHTITGREYLQRYGTEAHRDVFGTDFWVSALLPDPSSHPVSDNREVENKIRLDRAFPGVDVLVVTDARFPNEAERVLRLGGETWYIDAEGRLGPLPDDAHASERPLEDRLISKVVHNNGSLLDFEREITTAWHA